MTHDGFVVTEPNADLRETADDGPAAGAPQPEETGNLANWQLGEFRILRRLGRGGMADVYLADQTSLHRHVALKVLSLHVVLGVATTMRLQRS